MHHTPRCSWLHVDMPMLAQAQGQHSELSPAPKTDAPQMICGKQGGRTFSKWQEAIAASFSGGALPKATKEALLAYSKAHAWRQALQLLPRHSSELQHRRPVVIMNGIANACEKNSAWLHVVCMLETVQQQALEATVVSFSCVTAARARCASKRWRGALAVAAHCALQGVEANVVLHNVITSICEKVQQWRTALDELEHLPAMPIRPDLITHNAAISACEKSGQWTAALALLSGLSLKMLKAEDVAYNAAISACGRVGQWQRALELLAGMPRKHVRQSVVSFNAAITACSSSSCWQQGLDLLRALPMMELQANVVTITAVITTCAGAGAWEAAVQALCDSARVEPSLMTYNALLFALAHGEKWQKGLELLDHLRAVSIEPDAISCNTVITACSRASQWQQALVRLQHISLLGIQRSSVSFKAAAGSQWHSSWALLEAKWQCHGKGSDDWRADAAASGRWQLALTRRGAVGALVVQSCDWRQALALGEGLQGLAVAVGALGARWWAAVALIKRRKLDVVTVGALISTMEKGWQWRQGMHMLGSLGARAMQPSLLVCSAAASACEKCVQWMRTLALLKLTACCSESDEEGDLAYVHNAALSSCEKAFLWPQAVQLLAFLSIQGRADVITHSAAISACEKSGQWKRATALLTDVQQRQIQPNVITFNAAISACDKGEGLRAIDKQKKKMTIYPCAST
ncbi:unnamed protein product [Effrenium voratum]|nr:unnamed protein product [Effrenium voratum]